MTQRKKKRASSQNKSKSQPAIDPQVLDQLMSNYSGPGDLLGEGGILKQLTAALVNRAMEVEMEDHLEYRRGDVPPKGQPNRRNGTSKKTLRTDSGPIDVDVPRDRDASFEPQIVPKHERHFDGFDDKILSMYARGLSTRDIRAHIQEIYGVNVSPDLVSKVTDAVMDEVRSWQMRPLDSHYAVVYLDALVVKIRDKSGVRNRAIYLAAAIDLDGYKHVLGAWIGESEGAKYWLKILSELKQRGVEDIFILCADGLKGLPEAVSATYPETIFQTCIVHMIRASTRFVPWKERKALCADLKEIYTAIDADHAEKQLDEFEAKWGERYPHVGKVWRSRWSEVTPFLSFPEEIRRAVYTTNTIEAINRQVRKSFKTRGHMPNEDAAMKLLYLCLQNAGKIWRKRPAPFWGKARLQFSIHFAERMPY